MRIISKVFRTNEKGKGNLYNVKLVFTNGTSSVRRVYEFRKYGFKYFYSNKIAYKIFDFVPLTKEYSFERLGYVNENGKTIFVINGVEETESDESEIEVEEETETEELREGYVQYLRNPKHSKEKTISACIKNDIPVYLAGPAGSGKNFVLQKVANELGLEFYFTNSVQQEYKVTGFIDAGGVYHETEFYKAFKDGGLFFLDEIDASIPEVLILLNAAIANRYFEFPNGRIDAHEDFRVVAAGNTVGSGADELYVGRLVLDQATLDRFAIIDFDYERPIELSIAKGNAHLVDFVREIRRVAKQNGIRGTFSYRSIMMIRALESSDISLEEVLTITVFKGMRQDTINSFSLWNDNTRYGRALRSMQAN